MGRRASLFIKGYCKTGGRRAGGTPIPNTSHTCLSEDTLSQLRHRQLCLQFLQPLPEGLLLLHAACLSSVSQGSTLDQKRSPRSPGKAGCTLGACAQSPSIAMQVQESKTHSRGQLACQA